MKIRFTKNERAISFEVPPSQDPTTYGKKKLREMLGRKRLVGWSFDVVV